MKSFWSAFTLLFLGVALGAGSILVLKNRVQETYAQEEKVFQEEKDRIAIDKLEPLFSRFPVKDVMVRGEDGRPTRLVSVTLLSDRGNLEEAAQKKIKRIVEVLLLHFSGPMPEQLSKGPLGVSDFKNALLQDLNTFLPEARLVDINIDEILVMRN
ncbi:MAG: hypothetical protein AAGB46_02470 [Verrucomicrobiota bacterium]